MDRGAPDPDTGDPDEEALRARATALADAVEAAVGPWVRRSVERVAVAQGLDLDVLAVATDEAATMATAEVGPQVRDLLATDIDEQATNPLAVLRAAVRHPTAVLRGAGAVPVERDGFDRRAFPDDDYGLAPATFEDVDPALKDPGLEWGAAKAYVHLARRRRAR